jgi:hypothetical protein
LGIAAGEVVKTVVVHAVSYRSRFRAIAGWI